MRAIELFAGAGGLGMAVSKSGFGHEAVIEWNHDACQTIRLNAALGVEPVKDWKLHECDVRDFEYSRIPQGLDLVAGGPPCQPFSLGGNHRGPLDRRDMFPEAARAVRELKPRAFIFENVKGLLRQSFAKYFEYTILQLSYPEIAIRKSESWTDHLARLEKTHTRGGYQGMYYKTLFQTLNAADFGVPQRRDRVFIVGFRADLGIEWSFPTGEFSKNALLWSQWITGEYWDRHKVAKKDRPAPPPGIRERIGRDMLAATSEPWKTVRDAISDLPRPDQRNTPGRALNHVFVPGARSYAGHTGSPLDEPAKTLKAGDHGVPGGENMLLSPDGSVRYFTVREAARLQCFPDNYHFAGCWTEAMRQLGNAVPVRLAESVARSVSEKLPSPGVVES